MVLLGQFIFLLFAASFVAAFVLLIGGLCAAFDYISMTNKED
jgi:hypothetical protein